MQKDFRKETYVHRAGTHKWKQMEQREREKIRHRGDRRERNKVREKERKKWDGMLDYLPPGRSSSLQNY